jgi:glycosyltransferase involved in cell wall biosynthesis
MKILFTVEFYEPAKGGAQEVVKQIAERLAKRGHEVTVATSYLAERKDKELNGVKVIPFRIKGNSVKGITGEAKKYQDFLKQNYFDILMNYAAQSWPTDLAFSLLDRIRSKKVLVPLGYSKLHDEKYRQYFAELPTYLKKYDKLVYPSVNYQDKVFGDEHGVGDKAVIIPNGAGEEFLAKPIGFKKKFGIQTPRMLLSVSNHYLAKGHNFVIDAFRRLKRDDVTLVIIGERPFLHSWYSCWPRCKAASIFNRRIKVLSGVSRPWVISAYQEADLFLFGSRVECAPLVMYESFAAKLPFITTDVGNVKDHREYLKIVKTPQEMVEVANRLLIHPEERETMAWAAFNLWRENHTWSKIAGEYENLFQKLIEIYAQG